MDLRQLGYVVAVVDHGGFTRAAAAMHVAQPSLSQAIRSLEAELGVALFDRIGRTVRLTAAGRALLPSARQALRDVDSAREAVEAVRGVERGRLDLVSIPTLGVDPVALMIGAFHRSHPDVTVRLIEPDDAAAVAGMVAGGEAEVGFAELPRTEALVQDGRLDAVELEEQEYVAVLHRTVEQGPSVSMGRLAALPLVTTIVGTSTRRLIDDAFARSGRTPRIAIETDLRDVITAIVEAGGGYSILPRHVAERMERRGSGEVHVAEIVPRISRRVGMINRPGTLSPAALAFIAVAKGRQQRSPDVVLQQ